MSDFPPANEWDRRQPNNTTLELSRSMGRIEGQLASLESYLRSRDADINSQLEHVDQRLARLEKVESRAMGGALVISTIVGIAAWLLGYMKA